VALVIKIVTVLGADHENKMASEKLINFNGRQMEFHVILMCHFIDTVYFHVFVSLLNICDAYFVFKCLLQTCVYRKKLVIFKFT